MQAEPISLVSAPYAPLVPKRPVGTIDTFFYDNRIVRDFGIATVIWGIIGMLVGVLAAFELARPEVNMGTAYTTSAASVRCTPTL